MFRRSAGRAARLAGSLEELDWFYDLLATAVEGPAKAQPRVAATARSRAGLRFAPRLASQERIEVNLFTTGEASAVLAPAAAAAGTLVNCSVLARW